MTEYQDPDSRQGAAATTAHVAQDKAGEAVSLVGDKAGDIGGTAKEQATHVVDEATTQAKNLLDDLRGQLEDQARVQTQSLAGHVRRLSQELHEMGGNGASDSTMAGLARQLADGGSRAASRLEQRGPDGLLDDVRDFARRRPGTFLAGAAVAGFFLGRAGKGVGAADSSTGTPDGSRPTPPTPPAAGAGAAAHAPVPAPPQPAPLPTGTTRPFEGL